MKKNKSPSAKHNSEAEQPKIVSRPQHGYIYIVKNPASNELSVCAYEQPLKRGTHVIAPTRYGLDYAVVVGSALAMGGYEPGSLECQGACLHDTIEDEEESDLEAESENICGICYRPLKKEAPVQISGDIDWIDRPANQEDYERYKKLVLMEEEALTMCREKVEQHKLDMKLVSAHYIFGDPKILFFFTADNRVDFRELVKDLVTIFKIRIELRQIGVRDESRLLGGLGVCGRDFCCHIVTDKLNPVSIKMAKEQNLSLNSTKISGPCGRLLCCLSYEYDFYAEEKKKLPPEGSRIKVQHELMKITEVNILSRKISLSGSDGRFMTLPFTALCLNDDTSRWEIDKKYVDEFLSP
ncbi:MAG: regulatory iron-sulfur-containing complex subunit RicT [Sphaerochaetaceae bacterium]